MMTVPAKKPCPVTAEELKRLYEEMPSDRLAAWVTEKFGVPVSKDLVLNWLRAAGIPRRKYSPYEERRIECPYSAERLHEM